MVVSDCVVVLLRGCVVASLCEFASVGLHVCWRVTRRHTCHYDVGVQNLVAWRGTGGMLCSSEVHDLPVANVHSQFCVQLFFLQYVNAVVGAVSRGTKVLMRQHTSHW